MKIFYLYIVLLFSLGCKAQEFDLRNMKRFDEKVFKDWEVDTSKLVCNSAITYLKKDNKRAKIIIDKDIRRIRISSINDPYTYVYQYYIKTNILKEEIVLFYDMIIGKTYTYNEIGKIIKEENWDTPYKISIKELIIICKKKLGLDLMDMSLGLRVERYSHLTPIYVITIPGINMIAGEAKYITISADNGEILFEKEIHSKEEFKKSIEEIYNPSLNKK